MNLFRTKLTFYFEEFGSMIYKTFCSVLRINFIFDNLSPHPSTIHLQKREIYVQLSLHGYNYATGIDNLYWAFKVLGRWKAPNGFNCSIDTNAPFGLCGSVIWSTSLVLLSLFHGHNRGESIIEELLIIRFILQRYKLGGAAIWYE